ncbi:MAG: SpoIIE family protein phosphatase [Desulfobacteraceae bacterium]|nr:SpoIIE family protein phosphatase [Desulfobacteraceae bacterium]
MTFSLRSIRRYKKNSYCILVALIFTIFLGCPLFDLAFAAPPVILEENKGEYPLGMHIDILEDKEGKWTIDDIVSPEISKQFVTSEVETHSYGYTKSAYWVRIELKNIINKDSEWLLEMGYPLIDYIDMYIPLSANKGYDVTHTGDMLPFSQRDIEYHKFIFRLSMPPNQTQTIYLRFKTSSSMQIPLTLWSNSSFVQKVNKEVYALGLYYGIMLVMIFYNLFIFITVRDKSYIYYVLYIAGFSFFQMCLNGLAFEYLWPEYPWWASRAVPFFVSFAVFNALLFIKNFLKSAINAPKLNKIINVLIFIVILITGLSLFVSSSIITKPAVFLATISCVIGFLTGIICLKKRYRPARYFMIAWSVLLFGAVLYGLKTFGFVPRIFITEYSLRIGSALEVILLSLGLADRINDERRQKYLAQKEALENEKLARKAQTEAIENLHKADKLKDEFLANTSHELRTPLNGIIGIADSLLDGAAGKITGLVRENLSMMVNSGKRLANLVNDILDFSKLKNEDLQLQLRPVDLRELTDMVITLSKPMVTGKEVVLRNVIPQEMPTLHADENRLQQILYNLIGNAIKFTEQGSVEVSARVEGDKAEISVIDTGIGIPENKIDMIFHSFVQADGSTQRIYGGTGLGLTVSKNLVELHGGVLNVQSSVGEGSTFTFTMPVSGEEAQNTDVKTRLTNISFSHEHEDEQDEPVCIGKEKFEVLVVEDDPVNRKVLHNHLASVGFVSHMAEDGVKALEMLETLMPDIILMDLMMPRMNGLEACQQIKKNTRLKHIPVIMLTAKNQLGDLVDAFTLGANDYMTKPFSKKELLVRIQNLKTLQRTERLQGEMAIAEKIQTSILPKKIEHADFEIKAVMQPADKVGGDYYDVLHGPDGALWLGIGDVAGHGVTAGLIMLMAQTIKATLATQNPLTPRELICRLNDMLYANVKGRLGEDHFMTFTSLKYCGSGCFQHAGAHMDLIIYRKASQNCECIPTKGMWLNMIPDIRKHTKDAEFKMETGDILVLYSDGLTEAHEEDGELLKLPRFIEIIQRHAGLELAGMRDAIMSDVLVWCKHTHHDDMTLMLVKHKHV